MPNIDPDTDLLHSAVAGDRGALGQLLQSAEPELRIAIDARIPERLRAQTSTDDVLQITYADALHAVRRARFDTPRDFAAWIKRIALHNLDDAIRAFDADKRGGGRTALPLDAQTSSQTLLADLIAVDGVSPSMQLRTSEALALLASALDGLPNDYRTVVRLYDLEGRSIDDVAAAVGRSPGAVHLLRVRAHRRLRELLRSHRTDFRDLA